MAQRLVQAADEIDRAGPRRIRIAEDVTAGLMQADPNRPTPAGEWRLDHLDRRIRGGERPGHCSRLIRTAIQDQEDLGRLAQACQASDMLAHHRPQLIGLIVDGKDDRDHGQIRRAPASLPRSRPGLLDRCRAAGRGSADCPPVRPAPGGHRSAPTCRGCHARR